MGFGERATVNLREAGVLRVRAQGPHGRELFYPECETSRVFVSLLGQKSLTRQNLEMIKALGYVIKQVEVL